ncbi:MAG: hypothetical protein WD894_12780 [Pirellulales bacterium]
MKTTAFTGLLSTIAEAIAVSVLALSAALGGEPPAEREAATTQSASDTAAGFAQSRRAARGIAIAQAGGSGGGTRGVGSGGGFVGPRGSYSFSSQGTTYDDPAVIVTQPMSAQVQAEWKEDLSVMDKLLGDEIVRVSGESVPQAMGIRLTLLGHAGSMYLEGCGAVFSYGVNLPLAAGKGVAKVEQPPNNSVSAWQRAKDEIARGWADAGGQRAPLGAPPAIASGHTTFRRTRFDHAKLDELVSAIVRQLAEAKNIRHLREGEFVIVTVAGFDDAGAPVRLTLKVSKSDIGKAANGTLTPQDFKSCIGLRIG